MSVTNYLNSQIKRNETSVFEIVNQSSSKHICYVRIPNQIYFFDVSIDKIHIDKFIKWGIYDTKNQASEFYTNDIIKEILSKDEIKVIKVTDDEEKNHLTKFLTVEYSSYILGDLYNWYELKT